MTPAEDRHPGAQQRSARAPAAYFALLVIAGGVVEGALIGSVEALLAFLPEQVLDPSSEGGTGSAGLTSSAMIIGAAIGAISGGVVAVPAALGLVVAWAFRLRAGWSVALATAGLIVALWTFVFVLFPPDARLIALGSVALIHGAFGLVLIDGLGRRCRNESPTWTRPLPPATRSRRSRREPLRPARALWVIPGGIVGGAWAGVVFALLMTVFGMGDSPVALSSWLPVLAGVTKGAVTGGAFGLPAGAIAFGVLAVGWATRWSRPVQGACAAAAVTVASAATFVLVAGPGASAIGLGVVGGVAAAGTVAGAFVVDDSLERAAQGRRIGGPDIR